ncbi:embryonic ectoderm development protein [Purpureocillium lilacinum]|uniref:Embryonic ectoderm development protein n=1 Tax=Purpureocillium lilacinum TaxID=33203 RepID=A0A179GBA5_PURLI|nr:embryonic ectoderm development protein [Purpureocillium lilacinum]
MYSISSGPMLIHLQWTVPSLPTHAIDTPFQVHYPHFSTTAVHSGIVDWWVPISRERAVPVLILRSVSFYGDQVLSRACYDNAIVLWRIEGFSSTDPPPRYSEAPTPQAVISSSSEGQGGFTRSAFVPAISPGIPTQYTRLLEFHTPRCAEQFFMRFKLHHVPGQHAVLAFCNAAGSIFFWDFTRLTAYREVMERLCNSRQDKTTEQLPSWLRSVRRKSEAGGRFTPKNKAASASPVQGCSVNGRNISSETMESWTTRYSMEDPQRPLLAHKTVSAPDKFVGRQVGWSPGGEWCVVVGGSVVLMLKRWAMKS